MKVETVGSCGRVFGLSGIGLYVVDRFVEVIGRFDQRYTPDFCVPIGLLKLSVQGSGQILRLLSLFCSLMRELYAAMRSSELRDVMTIQSLLDSLKGKIRVLSSSSSSAETPTYFTVDRILYMQLQFDMVGVRSIFQSLPNKSKCVRRQNKPSLHRL